MKRFSTLYILLAVLLAFASCKGGGTASALTEGDTVRFDYAKHLQIVKHEGFTEVNLSDPWKPGRTLHTYLLVDASQKELPMDMPHGTLVRTPLKKAVVATSAHCALMNDMGVEGSLAGVCDIDYINLPWVKYLNKRGKVEDCGSGMEPTLEKIINLSPDAIFLSPFQNSGGYGKLEKLDIPIIEVADYMETSALGRAEWMKFYGLLFGCEAKANEIFANVLTNYNKYKSLASKSTTKKRVMMDMMTGSVWYVPGGQSTMGRLLADANASYAYSTDENSGSLSLPFESVLEKCADSDIWILRYGNSSRPMTLADIRSQKDGYTNFRPYKTGEVYGCNTLTTTFYEETSFHPDRLLRDFVMIIHPEANIEGEMKFFHKIK